MLWLKSFHIVFMAAPSLSTDREQMRRPSHVHPSTGERLCFGLRGIRALRLGFREQHGDTLPILDRDVAALAEPRLCVADLLDAILEHVAELARELEAPVRTRGIGRRITGSLVGERIDVSTTGDALDANRWKIGLPWKGSDGEGRHPTVEVDRPGPVAPALASEALSPVRPVTEGPKRLAYAFSAAGVSRSGSSVTSRMRTSFALPPAAFSARVSRSSVRGQTSGQCV